MMRVILNPNEDRNQAAQNRLFRRSNRSLYAKAFAFSNDGSISGLIRAFYTLMQAFNTHDSLFLLPSETDEGDSSLPPLPLDIAEKLTKSEDRELPSDENHGKGLSSEAELAIKRIECLLGNLYTFCLWSKNWINQRATEKILSKDVAGIRDELFSRNLHYAFLRMRILLDFTLPEAIGIAKKNLQLWDITSSRIQDRYSNFSQEMAKEFNISKLFSNTGLSACLTNLENIFDSKSSAYEPVSDPEDRMKTFLQACYRDDCVRPIVGCLIEEYEAHYKKRDTVKAEAVRIASEMFCCYAGLSAPLANTLKEQIAAVKESAQKLADESARELKEEADAKEIAAELRKELRVARRAFLEEQQTVKKKPLPEAEILAVGFASAEFEEEVYHLSKVECFVQEIVKSKKPGLPLRFYSDTIAKLDKFENEHRKEPVHPCAKLELQICRAELLLASLINVNLLREKDKKKQKEGIEKIEAQIRALKSCDDPHNLTLGLRGQLTEKLPSPLPAAKSVLKPAAPPQPVVPVAAAPVAIIAPASLKIVFPEEVQTLLKVLNQRIPGYFSSPVYAVGGCVRDHLRGENPKDYDFVCVGPFSDRIAVYPAYRADLISLLRVGFPGVRDITITPSGVLEGFIAIKLDGRAYDLWVGGKTLQEDAGQRDFTANSLYVDQKGDLISLDSRWQEDALHARCIPVNPDNFYKDPVRVLRALKFGIRGYSLEPAFQAELTDHMSKWRGLNLDQLSTTLGNHRNHFIANLNQLLFSAVVKGKLDDILSGQYLGPRAIDWATNLFTKPKFLSLYTKYKEKQARLSVVSSVGLFTPGGQALRPAAPAYIP